MRVALVIERLTPTGGVEGAAWATAHALCASGVELDVFAREGEEAPGFTLHRLPVGKRWQPKRVLDFSRAAARAAPRGSFDAVHSFSRTRHQDIYRTGGGCHAAYMDRAYGRMGAALRRISPRHATILGIETAVFRDESQWVQCNSEMVRDEILDRYGVASDRIVVIPNGVDVDRFHPGKDRSQPGKEGAASGDGKEGAASCELRRQWKAEGQRVWLLVGHGFARKGVDTAIRALGRAGDEDSQLWVAGRGDPMPLRKLAAELGVEERVRFLGGNLDPAGLYREADALLLPTRYDAFANVCLEAAASGLPIVTSGANGAAGWLGDAGLCVEDPEDIDGFAAALAELRDEKRREELGRAARLRAETRTWQDTAAQLRRLYERVMA